ncbi:MAG: hypothetical protein KGI06_05595 [Candidatus Micrarchaeota archaeon]|nr:hypothetical protein [Candidatus Micrarchaeota archaeon]
MERSKANASGRFSNLVRKTNIVVATLAIASSLACSEAHNGNHPRYLDTSTNCAVLYKERIEGLNLTPSQLKNDLGIRDNSRPIFGIGAKTYVEWSGWQGPGSYNAVLAACDTPYLSNIEKLNNWNYVLYGKNRIEPRWKLIENEKALSAKGTAQRTSPEIKASVDNLIRTGRMRVFSSERIR